ncbi:MAG: hypothetical protein OJF62_002002 [Pseudolabrys sp.]|nr:hypothetical protein [Pseudolabrys sp.]
MIAPIVPIDSPLDDLNAHSKSMVWRELGDDGVSERGRTPFSAQ